MIESLFHSNQPLDENAMEGFFAKLMQQGRPEGALGKLEEIALRLAGQQGKASPSIDRIAISLFAADHGIAVQDVSEQEAHYTQQTFEQFEAEQTPIQQLAQYHSSSIKASLEVINLGTQTQLSDSNVIQNAVIAPATQDFTVAPAMTHEQLIQALQTGIEAVERAHAKGAQLFIGGDLGRASTTSALAMISVLSGRPAIELVSLGKTRPLSSERHRAHVIDQGLALHQDQLNSPLNIIQHIGGFETAALCAAYARASQLGMTLIIDGLMSTVAFWLADMMSRNDQLGECQSVTEMQLLGQHSIPETLFCLCGTLPRLTERAFFGHQSEVAAHGWVLEVLGVEPILQLDMRLGQASGAALALPILQQACYLHA